MKKTLFLIYILVSNSLYCSELDHFKKELLYVKTYNLALELCKKYIAEQPDNMATEVAYDALIVWWHINGKYSGIVKPDVRELEKYRVDEYGQILDDENSDDEAENSVIKKDTLESHLEKFVPYITSLRVEIEPQLPRGVSFGAVVSEIISKEIIRKNLELSLNYNTHLE